MSLLCSPTLVFCSSGSSDSLETSASLFLSSRKPSKPHPTTTHPRLPPRQPVLHALSTVGRPSRMTRRFRRSRGWCNLPLGMDRVETLTSLGVLVSRARSQGGGDLDRSIGVMEDALALTLVGHAARSQALMGLWMSCFMRTRHRQGQGQGQGQDGTCADSSCFGEPHWHVGRPCRSQSALSAL